MNISTSVRDHRHFTGFSNVVWGLASVRCLDIRRSPLKLRYGTLLQTTSNFIRHWGEMTLWDIHNLQKYRELKKFGDTSRQILDNVARQHCANMMSFNLVFPLGGLCYEHFNVE